MRGAIKKERDDKGERKYNLVDIVDDGTGKEIYIFTSRSGNELILLQRLKTNKHWNSRAPIKPAHFIGIVHTSDLRTHYCILKSAPGFTVRNTYNVRFAHVAALLCILRSTLLSYNK